MQKICFILFYFFLFFNTIKAQDFDSLIKEANDLYDSELYENSAKKYEAALLLEEGHPYNYYNAACSWALASDTSNAIRNLYLSVEKGYKNLKHIKKDTDLSSLHELDAWNKILALIQKNIDDYEKDFDKPLKAAIEKLHVKDQMLRRLYKEAQSKFGKDSEEMDYFWQLMAEQDSINLIEVETLLEKHGWPGLSTVGSKANTTIWLVIQHAPITVQEKYLPLLKTSVREGESPGKQLAMLEDRILVRNDKEQVYGTQIKLDTPNGESAFFPIEAPEKVNQRRAEVGLGPIEDYAKHHGINWTIKQE